MQKILLVGPANGKSSKIGRVLETQLPYQVFTGIDRLSIQSLLNTKVFNLAVFDCENIDLDSLQLLFWLRDMDCSFPILLVGTTISAEAKQKITMLSDVHALTHPFNDKSMTGLVRKLLIVKRVPKQVYRRFDTNQIAEMEALNTGDSMLTSLYNLSKGGAYCEFESPHVLSVGDLLRLKVYLNDTESEYTFNAKVVWTTNKGRFTGKFGCGFKFVSSKEAYRNMLSRT